MIIAELRALLTKATPGPWTDKDYPALFGANECAVVLDPHPDGRFMLKVDTELVCAVINALPAMLDALEAARDTDWALRRVDAGEEFPDHEFELDNAWERLRLALEKLRSKEPTR